jgi:hypothetical protein
MGDTKGLMARLAAMPAIAGLVVCAALAALEASRLHVSGAWVLWVTAAVLAGIAVGLVLRQLWAYLFALAFWTLGALGLAGLACFIALQAATHHGGSDWVGIARFVIIGIAVVALIGAVAATVAAAALIAGWRAATAGRSMDTRVVSAVGAVVGLGVVGWLVGDQYVYRQLPAQSRCLTSSPRTCAMLARDTKRYAKPQRLAFALHGCQAGDDTSCRELIGLLERSEGAPVTAVAARCDAGQTDLCRRLATRLAELGDAARATALLERGCAIDARACSQAAEAAKAAGLAEVERRLLHDGCERDDGSSCRRLLRLTEQAGRTDDALALKTCLVGDVNDCVPLMKRDLAGVCEPVCEGSSELRLQSCRRCAEEAGQQGRRDLAERWLGVACRNNDRVACESLAGATHAPAQIAPLRVRPT